MEKIPSGLRPWVSMPEHYRKEMGWPVPLDHTDPPPPRGGLSANGTVHNLDRLQFLCPGGFRCAR